MPKSTLSPNEFLKGFPADMQRLANDLRALARAALPDTIEDVKVGWQLIGLHLPGKSKLIYYGFIIPHKDSVTLGFQHGICLDAPAGLLLGAEEKLVQVRYISLRKPGDIKRKLFTELLKAAADISAMPKELRFAALQSASVFLRVP